MSIQVLGITETLNNLNLKQQQLAGDLDKIAENAGKIVVKRAKENIEGKHGHERHIGETGNLRKSIQVLSKTHVGNYKYHVRIGSDIHYAPYVELCYDKTGGFLRPALKESEKEVNDYVEKAVAGDLDIYPKGGGRFGQRFTIEWVDIFVF